MHDVTLNLVVIRSNDFDRAERFYSALGLTFLKHSHGSGPLHLACEQGEMVFEIYPRAGDADATTSVRLGFRVPSVDAAVAHLAELGVTVISPPRDSPWGRRAVVTDFDGHRVELAAPVASTHDALKTSSK